MKALMFVLVWLNGALIGSVGTAVYLWWRLATRRNVVRPYEDVYKTWSDALRGRK